jgi:hypothetical protein
MAFHTENPDRIESSYGTKTATARFGAPITDKGQCGRGAQETRDVVNGQYKFNIRKKASNRRIEALDMVHKGDWG